jgi:Ca2+-binding EF-hand superfamily protein
MKGLGLRYYLIGVFVSSLIVINGDLLSAQEKGPPAEAIRGAYQQILAGADKNGDGKLSLAECMSISTNKSKIEKDCKYWDANGDGYITEEEYVKQARRIMR